MTKKYSVNNLRDNINNEQKNNNKEFFMIK